MNLRILLFLTSFLFSAYAATPAGEVITTQGSVKAVGGDSGERSLRRGSPFYTLDTIIVGAASKAQLKFSDGSIVTLIPSTEFQVSSYSFQQPGQKDSSVSSLVKGGFRAISGSIAQNSPSSVSFQTPVSTIGIRGTILEVVIAGGITYVACLKGTVEVSNAQGSVTIGDKGKRFASVAKNQSPDTQDGRPRQLALGRFVPPAGGINFGESEGVPASAGVRIPAASPAPESSGSSPAPAAPGYVEIQAQEGIPC